jgi:RNA polymerase-interacting CarD/CdnL/TRCF family regulator
MAVHKHKVGDNVVHWIYGKGEIAAVADKGLPGQPCFYYVIEGNDQTVWVPVDEEGSSSLHLQTTRSDFELLINILRSQGEKMANNPYQRQDQLAERMQKASTEDLCLVIRDLSYRSRWGKLSSSDIRVMNHAQSFLLDEWELSLGTPREQARRELTWIIKENLARQKPF